MRVTDDDPDPCPACGRRMGRHVALREAWIAGRKLLYLICDRCAVRSPDSVNAKAERSLRRALEEA